jgi:hypothetical protein
MAILIAVWIVVALIIIDTNKYKKGSRYNEISNIRWLTLKKSKER